MSIERITAPAAPASSGAYSHAVRNGDTVYLSGQLPIDPATGSLVEGGIAAETRQTLANVAAVLEAAGSSLKQVLRVGVYLIDHEDWAAMNDVYQEVFVSDLPARTAITVGPLAFGARIEIDVVAAC